MLQLLDRALQFLSDNADIESCSRANRYLLVRIIIDLRSKNTDLSATTILTDSLIDLANHQILAYPYKDVPTCWRRLLTDASLAMGCCLLMKLDSVRGTPEIGWTVEEEIWMKIIRVLDLAIVVAGSPGAGRREVINDVVDMAQQKLTELRQTHTQTTSVPRESTNPTKLSSSSIQKPQKRPRFHILDSLPASELPSFPPPTPPEKIPTIIRNIPRPTPIPSLLSFLSHINALHPTPLIISEGVIAHWPAFHPPRNWSDPSYLLSIASDRVVPVEIGSRYTDDVWTQRMMRFGDFVNQYVLKGEDNHERKETDTNSPLASSTPPPPQPIAYLAQHDLLSQIPRLRDDIAVPDYCYLSPEPAPPEYPSPPATPDGVITNAWFGPHGTVSPLHHDPYHNLLAQVVGRKFVRLYAPREGENLYPFEGMMGNTSQVDVENPDYTRFPAFVSAEYVECILSAGEMLYIPPKWWHYVRSLDASFSVSFWF
ncbi:hypothetical protein BC937DRAFT_89897 [Endogone sp. FLAS-F59071]|nr:hypothetical protein BC937DRAFT_89897 [Endogone sp. FLAS-F59071]|eukprot:RUS17504.1 hypothetical protein BC937DRAFT_89897 [Endogone sp. FLAS-F59071]